MSIVLKAAPSGNLDLFAWADAQQRRQEARPLGFAAQWVRQRHPDIPPSRARLIAELAGFSMEAA